MIVDLSKQGSQCQSIHASRALLSIDDFQSRNHLLNRCPLQKHDFAGIVAVLLPDNFQVPLRNMPSHTTMHQFSMMHGVWTTIAG